MRSQSCWEYKSSKEGGGEGQQEGGGDGQQQGRGEGQLGWPTRDQFVFDKGLHAD